MREVAKPDAVEDLLPGRQVLQQHFRGEVAFGQRRDRRQGRALAKDSVVATSTSIARGGRRAPTPRRRRCRYRRIARLSHDRPVGGAAEIGIASADGAGARGGRENARREIRGKS
jgi:hypothetical protein